MTPEQKARVSIDALLTQADWRVCDMAHASIHAALGVALREFPLNTGYGFADYLLCIDGKAAGVIEAKKEGSTATGVEVQSACNAQSLPALAEQHRIVAEVDRRLLLIPGVAIEVDTNLKHAQVPRKSVLERMCSPIGI